MHHLNWQKGHVLLLSFFQYGDYDVDVDFGCEPLTLRAKKTGRKSTVPRKRQHCVSHKSAALGM